MIHFGSYSYILTLGFLNGAVVAALLMNTRENRVANRVLAALLTVVIMRLVPYIIGYANFYDAFPWLSFAPFDLPLAIGPLLWLYVARLTSGQLPRTWRWHLLPAALHATATTIIFVFCTLPQKNFIATHIVDPFVAPCITFGSLAVLAFYTWKSLARLQVYQRWLDEHLSSREEYRLPWLRVLPAIFATTGIVWLVMALVDAFIYKLNYFDEFPFYVFQAFVAWMLGLLAMRYSATVYPLPTDALARTEAHSDDANGTVGDEPKSRPAIDWKATGEQYLDRIKREGWARDAQLTLATLAGHLGTNTNYLSRALNHGLDQTFNECINRLRVEAVAAELRAGIKRDLVQIGFDAGFNSKASFQRAFQRYMHCTPSAYREAQKPKFAR